MKERTDQSNGPNGAGAAADARAGSRAAPRMSELVAGFDWAATPLGPAAGWPESLKAVVRILLTSRFPMWMAWGPELPFLYNDAYARTSLGKKHPWALGRPTNEVWSEIWKDIGPRIHEVMETGEASWEETLLLFLERSGYAEETYHTFSYSPLAGADGRIEGMLCVVMEDTERVIGERQLSSLSALSAALSDAIAEQDVYAAIERGLDGQRDMPCTLTYLFNRDATELNLVAKTGIDSAHPAACVAISAESKTAPWPIHLLLEANRAITIEDLALYFPDLPPGCWDKPPARARLVPIVRQGQARPAGVFIAALNPYRQLDASYAGFLDLIAGQIAASVTNAQAYEEERRRAASLAELDRAKTAFFSNVSHELRTPLTLILGPVEDAITSQTPPTPAAIEMLHRNALRLLKLVNGLLDFVRIEVGRLRASYEATDLSLFTAQLASVFRSAVERAGLKLVVDCPPLEEPVYVDREMWEKIVLNLLSNALKSTFEGEIRVRVRSTGTGAEMSVEDTGTGISESNLAHLFERFRRIDGARRRSHEGSGIGLALVRELVEMHGGTIAVKSAMGAGTAFTVTLPYGHGHLSHGSVVASSMNPIALQGSAVAYVEEALGWLPGHDRLKGEIARNTAGDTPQTAAAAPEESKPTVLLVDDNADMREYVRGLLGGRYSVSSAKDGQQALQLIRHHAPDLVLTDVMMPELDGFGLLAELRANPRTSTVPVIMLSARAGEESRIEGIDAGADDYLTKPFTARELMARVEAQLKMARLREEAAAQEAALNREVDRVRQFAWEVLEHIPDAFATLDREFRVTYSNAAAQRMSVVSGAPPMGRTLWELYPRLAGNQVETNIRRAMAERTPVEFEQYFESPVSWYQFRVFPQPGEGLIVYVRETTAERKTEQVLRKSEQLVAAGRLAASIAHEINNPLEALTNLLFLANMDPGVTGATKGVLEAADKELHRLSHIAGRSLKFYRQRTAPAQTSLEEIAEAVLFFHEPDFRARQIDLDRRYRPSPTVRCLPGEVQQVATNLIANALDAVGDKGRMVVEVRPDRDRAGHEGVTLTVADDGCGMDAVTLGHLFHPFITTKGEAGTGLGLWVSKGILDRHHARIAVRSRPGEGTVFRIFFPLDAIVGDGQ